MKIYHRSHNVKQEGSLLHFNELLCAFPRMVTNRGSHFYHLLLENGGVQKFS